MDLAAQSVPVIADAIRGHLAQHAGNLVGVSCIARGADSLFARIVLDLGGELHVVLPSANYAVAKVKPDHRALFDELLTRASIVETMPFATANRDAYVAANNTVLSRIDQLVAVWDGQSSPDRGGTAGVVEDARERGIDVHVIWPAGSQRDR